MEIGTFLGMGGDSLFEEFGLLGGGGDASRVAAASFSVKDHCALGDPGGEMTDSGTSSMMSASLVSRADPRSPPTCFCRLPCLVPSVEGAKGGTDL